MPTDPVELSVDFGRRLAAARTAAGLSQRELARAIGHEGPDAVSRYERRLREPRLSAIVALAGALNMPVGALLPGSGRTNNPREAEELALAARLRATAERQPRAATAAIAAASAVLTAFDAP